MLPHHAESIERMQRYFADAPEVLGLVLGGSVARGRERPDSDLDAMVVVTPERHAALRAENRLTECIHGHCTYDGGYFDVKYLTMDYLRAAAERGSDPTRNSFVGARVLFSRVDGLEEAIGRIAVYPVGETEKRIRMFYAIFALSAGYLYRCALQDGDLYFAHRIATDAVYGGLRMFYARNAAFFPCHRRMLAEAARLPDAPAELVPRAKAFAATPTEAARDAFVAVVEGYPGWPVDFGDHTSALSDYVRYMEQSWLSSEDNVFEL